MIDLSVIIPTYNPNKERLNKTLKALQDQSLAFANWELIIVDNNSLIDFTSEIDLSWHPAAKIIFEPRQGLTYARLKGFLEANGSISILVDDDNILDKNYLTASLEIFKRNQRLGTIGGKSIPIFEREEPEWLINFYDNLALRDFGDSNTIEGWQNTYPKNAPIGAGMAVRKEALKSYIAKIKSGKAIISDRKGKSLCSGGDNDIVLEIIKSGWQSGYFPELILYHIIPEERFSVKYLTRLSNSINKSWIQVLDSHGINPWAKIPRWTVPFRKLKAWFSYKAWQNKVNYIKWRGACGTFDGLCDNSKSQY